MMRITLCSILWVVGACVGSVVAEEPSAGASHDRVKVELYMETLCPYCARFIRQTVNKAFESGMGPIMDLELIPWGNAAEDSKGELHCQHGKTECWANTMLSCVMNHHPEQEQFFKYVNCTEGASRSSMRSTAKDCVQELQWSWGELESCATGEAGRRLQEAARDRTAALEPPHRWVPWVVVNGIPLMDDFPNLIRYLCVASTGDRPPICTDAKALRINRTRLARLAAPLLLALAALLVLVGMLSGAVHWAVAWKKAHQHKVQQRRRSRLAAENLAMTRSGGARSRDGSGSGLSTPLLKNMREGLAQAQSLSSSQSRSLAHV